MADTRFCIQCSKTIGMWDKTCKYCGTNQFGINNEYYPNDNSIRAANVILQGKQPRGIFGRILGIKQDQPVFSEEECFLYGIHPDDEMYRKTMELNVLSKNYKK